MTAPELRKLGAGPLFMSDFSDRDQAVIRERRKYQSAAELAAVFGTTSRVIAAICRRAA